MARTPRGSGSREATSRARTRLTPRLLTLSETLRLVFRKRTAVVGISLIILLAVLGGLAPVLTPYSPRMRDVVAGDFATPDWAAPPDVARNVIKTLTSFRVQDRRVSGDVKVDLQPLPEGGFRVVITGTGTASVLVVSDEMVEYPYRPARSLDVRIAFNTSYLEGRGQAWYNVDTLMINKDLVERGEKLVLEVPGPNGSVLKYEVPRGFYSLYDIVTTRVGWVFDYYRGAIQVSAPAVLPNSMRNFQQPYIRSIRDPETRNRVAEEFGKVNAARELLLEKGTRLYIAVNITYYCNPADFMMNCRDGSLVVSYAPVRVFIKGDAFGVLGTTAYGNCVWTQWLYGARTAIVLGLGVAAVTTLVALIVGLAAGYRAGSTTDMALTFLTDVMYFIPLIPLVMVVGLVFGRTLFNIYAVIIALSWQGGARIIRQWTITLRSSLYVEAAKALGASEWRIMMKHIAPQLVPYLVYRIVMTGTGYGVPRGRYTATRLRRPRGPYLG
jgi:ABC-type dipeptide/oligopeptide/nickel transport system permease subunit